jgi:hypothetical protein
MKDFINSIRYSRFMKMRGVLFIFVFLMFISSVYAADCIPGPGSTGHIRGYVDDTTGTRIAGATVIGETSCTLPAQDNGLSVAEGFYQVYNLADPSGGLMRSIVSYIHPIYGLGSGSKTINNVVGTVSELNVTICYPPTAPVVQAILDTHNTVIEFNWTSGTDPINYNVRDEFVLSGGQSFSQDVNPAIAGGTNNIQRNLPISNSYTWQVRTCNMPPAGVAMNDVFCCSAWSTDGFNIGNLPPTAPNGSATRDGVNAVLNWTSGTDPESDPTYDQFRFVGGQTVGNSTSSVLSPIIMATDLLISWEIRTCDNFNACSSWVRIDSVFCPIVEGVSCPPSGGSSGGGSSGGGGGGSTVQKIVEVPVVSPSRMGPEIFCNGNKIESDLLKKIDLKFTGERLKVVASGDMFSVGDLNVCPSCFDGKKDGDETGVDCGGSCRACTEAEKESGGFLIVYVIIAGLLLAVAGFLAIPYINIARIKLLIKFGQNALKRNEESKKLTMAQSNLGKDAKSNLYKEENKQKPLTREQVLANVKYAADNYNKSKAIYYNKLDKVYADKVYKDCITYFNQVKKAIEETNAKISIDALRPKEVKDNKGFFSSLFGSNVKKVDVNSDKGKKLVKLS